MLSLTKRRNEKTEWRERETKRGGGKANTGKNMFLSSSIPSSLRPIFPRLLLRSEEQAMISVFVLLQFPREENIYRYRRRVKAYLDFFLNARGDGFCENVPFSLN